MRRSWHFISGAGLALFLAISLFPGPSSAAVVLKKPSPLVEAVDQADQAAVDLFRYDRMPIGPDRRKTLQTEAEASVDRALDAAYGSTGLALSDWIALTGIDIGVRFRRQMDNEPFPTEISSLEDRLSCRGDVVLGRHLARYARALARRDKAEQLLVLMEVQSTIGCLSDRQVNVVADHLGLALINWQRERGNDLGDDLADRVLLAALNPVVLVFDQSKHQGPTYSYIWLQINKAALQRAAADLNLKLHLHDYLTGMMVGLDTPPSLAELMDPENIGFGSCSMLEMQAKGSRTGNFGCGREVDCSAAAAELLGRSGVDIGGELPSTSVIPNQPNFDLGSRGNRPGFVRKSPYGIPESGLRDNCSGVGSSIGDAGINGFAGSGLGMAGCVADVMMAQAATQNRSQCVLEAHMNNQPQPGTVLGTIDPRTGLPIIRGITGAEDECTTDPLMQDSGTKDQQFSLAKQRAAEYFRSEEGKKFAQAIALESVDRMEERWRKSLQQLLPGRDISNAKKAVIRQTKQDIQNNPGKYAEAAAKAVEEADRDDTVVEQDQAVGKTDIEGNVSIDVEDHPSESSMQATLEHEAGVHAVSKAVSSEMDGPTLGQDADHQSEDNVQNANPKFKKRNDDLYKKDAKQLEATIRAKMKGTIMPSSPDGPDGQQCVAMSAAMKAAMECESQPRPPLERPPGIGRRGNFLDVNPPINPDLVSSLSPDDPGTIDPSYEQFIASQSNPLSQCFKDYGYGAVGFDSNGRLIVLESKDVSAAECGAIDCKPPARARNVGGVCRCVTDNGAVMRDFGVDRVCLQSDACLGPNPQDLQNLDSLEGLRQRLESIELLLQPEQ